MEFHVPACQLFQRRAKFVLKRLAGRVFGFERAFQSAFFQCFLDALRVPAQISAAPAQYLFLIQTDFAVGIEKNAREMRFRRFQAAPRTFSLRNVKGFGRGVGKNLAQA